MKAMKAAKAMKVAKAMKAASAAKRTRQRSTASKSGKAKTKTVSSSVLKYSECCLRLEYLASIDSGYDISQVGRKVELKDAIGRRMSIADDLIRRKRMAPRIMANHEVYLDVAPNGPGWLKADLQRSLAGGETACRTWDARIKFLKSQIKETEIWVRAVKKQKALWTCRKEAALKKMGGDSSLRHYSGICTSDDTAEVCNIA